MLPADNHVHTRWSYDAPGTARMDLCCRQAVDIGLPAVAFTEHLEFTEGGDGDLATGATTDARWRIRIKPLDVAGYLADIAECRERFPGLRILSGVEAGESHLFAASASEIVDGHDFDRVLGSLHAVPYEGKLIGADALFGLMPDDEAMRYYFAELIRLIEDSGMFQVLAHLDFPRRYWPRGPHRFTEAPFEEEYRAVLRALARSGRVLEINTKTPLASADMVRWWREEGGDAVSFGSDAHVPGRVGDRFKLAVDVVEQAGFRPGRDPYDFWRS
ncbi:MAG: PHP domain-containing protein [Nocardiopsaceae bacterium]|nr:PHP domain-containing protein [Nocardiopsaceae bacterium]